MREDLTISLEGANSDPEIDALIITGEGDRAFCAGQDWHESANFSPSQAEKAIPIYSSADNRQSTYDFVSKPTHYPASQHSSPDNFPVVRV